MTIKVGINGFGRIGRIVFRAAQKRSDIEIVAINDLLDADYMAYMLKYDSTHGRFDGTVEVKDGHLIVNGKKIRVTAERDPANLKWDEVGVDVVAEATGLFLTDETARKHITAGAKKVVMTGPSKDTLRCSLKALTSTNMLARTSFPTLPAPPTAWLRWLKLSTITSASSKV